MWLAGIWAVFSIMFIILGFFHWNLKGKSISHFRLTEKQMPKGITVKAVIAGTDIVEFATKFNDYIDHYNQTARGQHKAQAIGYWIASATALFSLAITLLG